MINKGDLIADRYLILDTLGEGGMSNVYLAEDQFLHRKVALKSLRFDVQNNPQIKIRFKRESIAMSELSSPYIVNILDVGDDDSFPYIVMEYVAGSTLKQYIHQHYPLEYPLVVRFMMEILQGVTVAHRHGIIHRDLKPQNVMITPSNHVKVSDFGIALSLGEQSITQTDSTLGSVHYMAPERVRGERATAQSDIYSLGIILYEMLTGKLPFDGETSLAIALKHFNEEIPDMKKALPDLPQPLENVVLKATAKDPKQRYSSTQAMANDLRTALDPNRAQEPKFVALPVKTSSNLEATKVMPNLSKNDAPKTQTTPPKPRRRWWRKKRWWLFGLLLLGLILLGGWLFWGRAEVAVPDVNNLSLSQANNRLIAAKLKPGAVIKQTSATVPAKKVIRTIPNHGVRLKTGAKVKLVVSSGSKKQRVPNVIGLNYAAAAAKLRSQGYRVQRVNRYSKNVSSGIVLRQSPKYARARQKVRLVVSLGPHRHNLTVKDLTGYSLRSARDYADEVGLTLVVKEQASDSVDKGLIISQDPSPGTRVAPGSDLTVVVSTGAANNKNSNDKTSDNDAANNDHGANTNTPQNYEKTVTIPYDSQNATGSNQVQIYLKDNNRNLTDLYKAMTIKADTNVVLPFVLKKGDTGQYRIVRDGQVIESQTVTGN